VQENTQAVKNVGFIAWRNVPLRSAQEFSIFAAIFNLLKKSDIQMGDNYSLSWKSLKSHLNVSQSKFFDLFRRAYFLLFPRNKAKKLPVRQLKAIPETSKKDYIATYSFYVNQDGSSINQFGHRHGHAHGHVIEEERYSNGE